VKIGEEFGRNTVNIGQNYHRPSICAKIEKQIKNCFAKQ
jgi:hypothetical protein